jgi:response regulator RpfG family c-di-GMP phosphodiesterase
METIMEEIRAQRNKQFAPEVVTPFLTPGLRRLSTLRIHRCADFQPTRTISSDQNDR